MTAGFVLAAWASLAVCLGVLELAITGNPTTRKLIARAYGEA